MNIKSAAKLKSFPCVLIKERKNPTQRQAKPRVNNFKFKIEHKAQPLTAIMIRDGQWNMIFISSYAYTWRA